MNISISKLTSSLVLFLIAFTLSAQVVSDVSELQAAIGSAVPGSTIILEDGTWTDVFIDIEKNGSEAEPITITAQNPGAVFLTGNSRVYMEGSHLTVSGLIFKDAANLVASSSEIEPVIELKECDYCKIINNKIDNYNGTEEQKDLKFKWVLTDGQYNEIAYNSFIGKYGVGSIINDNRNSSEADYLTIHHNYFAERTPINEVNEDNDQDAIRIGNSSTSLDDSFSEVYANYFHNFAGEIEVISNKSGGNKYYDNTFRNYSGTLTLRHGDNCEVYGNYFFAEGSIMSGGVRVIGEGHKIYNNYIEGVNSTKPDGATSNATGGINVSNGRQDTEINGYYQVKNTYVVNNTLVNCDYALRIGTKVSSDLSLEPEDLVVANNIMYNSSINPYQIVTQPSGNSTDEGNISDLEDGDLVDDGMFFRLTEGSAAIGAGLGDYSFLSQDVTDGERDDELDAGAEEFASNGSKFPYGDLDIGLNVGFGAVSNSITSSSEEIKFGVCGGTSTFQIATNVDWEISNDLPWLSFDVSSGSGTSIITATTTENSTGTARTGTFTINEVEGGEDLSTSMNVEQVLTSVPSEIQIISTTSIGMQIKDDIAEENAYNDNLDNYWTGDPTSEEEVSITFDLGELHFLTGIGINFWKADERTTTFSIAISDEEDGTFTTIIDTQESASEDVTLATEQLFSLQGKVGRYVKFIGIDNSSSSSWTSIANVNIYGDINCENAISNVEDQLEIDPGISIFPVPAEGDVITILSKNKALGLIRIYNQTGQLVKSTDAKGSYSERIDIANFSDGFYIVYLKGIGSTKFIKQ